MTDTPIHYNPPVVSNNGYFCGVDRTEGFRMSPDIDKVTCIYCLRKLALNQLSFEAYPQAKRCDGCKKISMTEKEQQAHYLQHGTKPEHFCFKYNIQIFHPEGLDILLRCRNCLIQDGKELAF